MAAKANKKAAEAVEDDDDLFTVPTTLEPDTYQAKLVGLYKKDWGTPNQFNPDKPNVSIMWKMNFARINDDGTVEIVRDEYTDEPLEFEFSTSTAISAKSKAYKWATAFLRKAPSKDDVVGLRAALVGKKAMAVIEQKENGFPGIVDLFPAVGIKD